MILLRLFNLFIKRVQKNCHINCLNICGRCDTLKSFVPRICTLVDELNYLINVEGTPCELCVMEITSTDKTIYKPLGLSIVQGRSDFIIFDWPFFFDMNQPPSHPTQKLLPIFDINFHLSHVPLWSIWKNNLLDNFSLFWYK